nr:retrovirus-related Pol polyprotein from transposon TNT 1-94 [Tanacetum cinerariifolium]
MNNNELNEQLKELIEKNNDLLAQTKLLKEQLQVKHVVIDTHLECQEKYAKLEAERYEYMIRYSAYFDNDKQHRKQIADQQVLFDKMSVQVVESDKHVRDLKNTVLEKDFKISELEEYLDTFSSVRRPKNSGVMWKKKGSSNTSNVGLSAVSVSNLNKNVKRYSHKDLLACNNSHLGETRSDFFCNDAMNVSCDSRMNDLLDDNNFFIFGDVNVVFRRNACFVRNLEGVDLLKGDRSTNLYTINLHEMASASPIRLMAHASSTKSWLWHQRLSHLNFDTINDLPRNDLVSCLPKFKYNKEHLCPSCEQGKSKRASHPPKPVPNSKKRLHLPHMDLCGPMRIGSINGKRKLDISFLHVFGALCYPKNDHEDIGKLGAKGDIGFFIGNSNVKRALFTTPVAAKSKNLGTTSVVAKSRLGVVSPQKQQIRDGLNTNKFSIGHPKAKLFNHFQVKQRVVIQLVLWIIDSGCSKHMIGNLQLLRNFIEKFMGTVRFRNDHFAEITGYRDYVQGNLTIYHIYYVKGLGHNLFSVEHFCDGDLEVAFRSDMCYVWNFKGDVLLTDSCVSNLYTISISEMAASSPLGIVHQTSIARTPKQNGVVERRNRTLIKAARTMLIFSKAPEFLWAEAIATACFTQNRSTIYTRYKYYAMSLQEMSDNSTANTLENKHTSSLSIVVEKDEAPQIVSSSAEQVFTELKSPVLNENTDEFVQEDIADFDGNVFYNAQPTLVFKEAKSSSIYQDPSNMHEFH